MQRLRVPRGYVEIDVNQDAFETLSHARSIVGDPFASTSSNSSTFAQTRSSPGPLKPTFIRQYDYKTARASMSPSRLPRTEESTTCTRFRKVSKTLPARNPRKLVTRPSMPDAAAASSQTNLRTPQQQVKLLPKNRYSSRLRGLFIPPASSLTLSKSSRATIVTKPKAPLLLTQLRAQRHKAIEESTKIPTANMAPKRKKNPASVQYPSTFNSSAPKSSPSTVGELSLSKSEPIGSGCLPPKNSKSILGEVNTKCRSIKTWQSTLQTGPAIATPITGHSRIPNMGSTIQAPMSIIHSPRSRQSESPQQIQQGSSIHYPERLDPLDLLPSQRNRLVNKALETFALSSATIAASKASSITNNLDDCNLNLDSSLASVIHNPQSSTSNPQPEYAAVQNLSNTQQRRSYSHILTTPVPPPPPSYSKIAATQFAQHDLPNPQVLTSSQVVVSSPQPSTRSQISVSSTRPAALAAIPVSLTQIIMIGNYHLKI
jgi:hypothetical protein